MALPKNDQREVALSVAFRAASRVLPIAVQYSAENPSVAEGDLESLPIFAAIMVAGVALHATIPIANNATDLAVFATRAGNSKYANPIAAANAAAYAAKATRATGYATTNLANAIAAANAADYADYAGLWRNINVDLEGKGNGPLWPEGMPTEIVKDWAAAKTALQLDTGADWSFWIFWYERVLAGRNWLPDALASIINTLTKEDWQKGPAHIIPMFDGVLAMYELDDVEREHLNRPRVTASEVNATRAAMIAHRAELPATFDAVLGLIALEVERLQKRNYISDDDRDECSRQIRVLTALSVAVGRMMPLIPCSTEMPTPDAEQAAGLAQLYLNRFKEWPRANADEIVDNTYRLALIGVTATLLPMVGVAANVAAIAGAALFGGKRLLDGAKAAKDVLGFKQ